MSMYLRVYTHMYTCTHEHEMFRIAFLITLGF